MTTTATPSRTDSAASARGSVLLLASAFVAIGLGMVYLAGFANADLLHNGAHDSRHSFVLPCH